MQSTKLVARLEDKGHDPPGTRPAGRTRLPARVTDAGQAALRAGLKAHIPRLDAEMINRMTAAQRRQLQDLLSRIDPGETNTIPRPDTQ